MNTNLNEEVDRVRFKAKEYEDDNGRDNSFRTEDSDRDVAEASQRYLDYLKLT